MDETNLMADIRRYEEILARDPLSYCFAPLSDVYRRLGRLEEALDVAIRGCETHPNYIAGFMALGRVCFEKGLHEEARQALEKVVGLIPENILAHQLLAQIYRSLGDIEGAIRSEGLVRLLRGEPDEPVVPERVEPTPGAGAADAEWGPETVAQGLTGSEVLPEEDVLDLTDEIIELGEEIPELGEEIPVEQDDTASFRDFGNEPKDSPAPMSGEPTPQANTLSTVTIAELYLAQGFPDRALGIYRELLAADPSNEELLRKVEALSALPTEETQSADASYVEENAEPDVTADVAGPPNEAAVLATLEGWLENIRRSR